MDFGLAIQNLIYYSDRIKEIDRNIVRTEEENKKRLADAVENGLIHFEKAKTIQEEVSRLGEMKLEIEQAVQKIVEAKEYLHDYLRPFEGYRVVYDYLPEKGQGRTCQVFLEDEVVKFI